MSFINERVQPEGLTFDDVLLIPAYSEVLPREVNVQTRFSRNIKLNIPIVSAAMDTVTEAPLAIALAREGGIGVIHKNMSIAEQAAQVRKVKRAENGMIYDPVTISKEHTVGDALNLMKENKIGGIPVVDARQDAYRHRHQPRPAFPARHVAPHRGGDDARRPPRDDAQSRTLPRLRKYCSTARSKSSPWWTTQAVWWG